MTEGETPYPVVDRVLTGHERRGHNRCWRRRGTPTALLIHTRSGHATYRVEGHDEPYPIAPGDTVLWLSGAMQDFGTAEDGPWELVWAHFQPRQQWHEWLDTANPGPSRLDEPIQEAVLFIAGHLDRRLRVGEIADAVHLSPSRFAHLFKQQLGTSPARFVEQRRMERARTLLASSSLRIGAVAEASGFASQFHFAARFRAVTGMSPTEWRDRSDPAGGQRA